MKKDVVYILHEFGAKGHYTALKHLLNDHNADLRYREFSVLKTLPKSLKKGNFKLFIKQFVNLFFLIDLLFTTNKKIVVGIAPFDYKISRLLYLLKRHTIFYHSSWTYWDKSFHPKAKKNTEQTFKNWEFFLKKVVKHHFVVTNQSKNELVENYNIDKAKISVVNHAVSFPDTNFKNEIKRKENSFVFCGRLEPLKGIVEALEYFKSNPHLLFTVIGDGSLKKEVVNAAQNCKNITYKGYVADRYSVLKAFKEHEFLILNSKKTKKWEELFGIVIIEAMSQGTIPIASNHSGPKEIIDETFGYLFEEGKLVETLDKIIKNDGFSNQKSSVCKKMAVQFSIENIAKKWRAIIGN